MSVAAWIAVAPLGALGALARLWVDAAVVSRAGRDLPLGTLVVNVSGAALLGLVTGLAVGGQAATLLGAATLGSYTTFSTWMFESQRLVEEGQGAAALLNVAVSLAFGLAAVAVGRTIGAHL